MSEEIDMMIMICSTCYVAIEMNEWVRSFT